MKQNIVSMKDNKKYGKEGKICKKCDEEIGLRVLLNQGKRIPLGLACTCTVYSVEPTDYGCFEHAQNALLQREGLTIQESVSQAIRQAAEKQRLFREGWERKHPPKDNDNPFNRWPKKRPMRSMRVSYGR